MIKKVKKQASCIIDVKKRQDFERFFLSCIQTQNSLLLRMVPKSQNTKMIALLLSNKTKFSHYYILLLQSQNDRMRTTRPPPQVSCLAFLHSLHCQKYQAASSFQQKIQRILTKSLPGGLSISRTFETDLLFLLHFDIIFTTTQKRSEQKVEVEKQKTF